MEGKYSIEEIEFIYGSECDCNAQVTRPIEFTEEATEAEPMSPVQTIIKEEEPMNGTNEDSYMRIIKRQNTATNWLLVAILFMLFMFMIFKCD